MRRGLSSLVGLGVEKSRAEIDIRACKVSGETFPHTLIYGRGGIGKTSFARAIAEELGYWFVDKEAASFRHRKDIITCLQESEEISRKKGLTLLLFIDECHRLTNRMQEVFYFPMVENRVDMGLGSWYVMRPFTLFCATTQVERLDRYSFIPRFQNVWEMRSHSLMIMDRIIYLMFMDFEIDISMSLVRRIALLCDGIPRTAYQLVRKIRNYALAHGRKTVETGDVNQVVYLEGLH